MALTAALRSDDRELADALAAARRELGTVALVLALAAVAWWVSTERMAGMDAGPGTDLGSPAWFAGVWTTMMAAMMLPSLVPAAALQARLTAGRSPLRAVSFAAGYLAVWALAGMAAYGLYELGRHVLAAQLAWHAGGRWVAGGVLALAAAYQLTPVKRACLQRCRSPRAFLAAGGRQTGVAGVLPGLRAGVLCLGSSWALMAALFALGLMSLTWMALVAGAVALEKVAPWRTAAVAATTAVLAVCALFVLVSPHDLPGLVVPGGSPTAMHAMGAMH